MPTLNLCVFDSKTVIELNALLTNGCAKFD